MINEHMVSIFIHDNDMEVMELYYFRSRGVRYDHHYVMFLKLEHWASKLIKSTAV